MTNTIPNFPNSETAVQTTSTEAALTDANLCAIFEWLATPQSIHATDELSLLQANLLALRTAQGSRQQRAEALEQLYTRSNTVIVQLMATLTNVALPVPRKVREMVRSIQDLLETLTDIVQTTADDSNDSSDDETGRQPKELAAWRNLNALAQHLLISNLVAAPACVGIWQKLHHTYAAAQRLLANHFTPVGESQSLEHIYKSALLLGCSQPDSFTSTEVGFIASYLHRFAHYVELPSDVAPENSSSNFWLDLLRDSPAFPCSRKAAPAEASVRYFSCAQLAKLVNKQIDELNTGCSPHRIDLPDFAATPAGRGVLTRLAGYWGAPGKRRFPHRRRNHRAEICAGLHKVWLLFQLDQATKPEISTWMITNQSPDGYAIMHVGGKTGKLAVGDITAIRSESENNWQICLVRWALSENPEHLEMGLQILAPSAVPAILTLPSERDISERLPVLLLPEVPTLRATEALVTNSGALNNRGQKHVLIVAQGNVKVREIKTTRIEEQTSSVEVFAIETEKSTRQTG
jgi:hypothetical protein